MNLRCSSACTMARSLGIRDQRNRLLRLRVSIAAADCFHCLGSCIQIAQSAPHTKEGDVGDVAVADIEEAELAGLDGRIEPGARSGGMAGKFADELSAG